MVRAFLQAAFLAVVLGLGVAGSPGLSGDPGTASMGLLMAIVFTLSMPL